MDHLRPFVLCMLCRSVVSNSLRPHELYVALQAPLSMGILQARILEWVAMPCYRWSSQHMDRTQGSPLQADSLVIEPPGKPKNTGVGSLSFLQGNFQTRLSCIAGGFFTIWTVTF